MKRSYKSRIRLQPANLATLFVIFFFIACGLGYPILNRYDPRKTALSDVKTYAAIVTGATHFDAGEMRSRRYRVLVPWIAKPFYLVACGRFATWDPVMFGLLVSDSLFVAGTGVLIVVLGGILARGQAITSAAGVVGALLYLLNFAVPNLRLVGLVDAGEGFFLAALLWSLAETKLWALPFIAVLGALTKESFVPFSMVFTIVWFFAIRSGTEGNARDKGRALRNVVWILVSWILSVVATVALHWSINGTYENPLRFGMALHRGGGFHFTLPLHDRNLLYIFLWLLPTAIPNLKRFPRSWLFPVAATCVSAYLLDVYFGGGPDAGPSWGRVLFSIAGPVLSLSSALFVVRTSEGGFGQVV